MSPVAFCGEGLQSLLESSTGPCSRCRGVRRWCAHHEKARDDFLDVRALPTSRVFSGSRLLAKPGCGPYSLDVGVAVGRVRLLEYRGESRVDPGGPPCRVIRGRM